MSYDKTELFISSLIRLIVYVILLKITRDYKYIQTILYIIILINIIYIIIIVMKTPIVRVGMEQSISGLD